MIVFSPVFLVTGYSWGMWEIIKRASIPTLGKNVIVAGRSKNIRMPTAMLLHTSGAHECPGDAVTVTISQYTPKEQLKKHTILADTWSPLQAFQI